MPDPVEPFRDRGHMCFLLPCVRAVRTRVQDGVPHPRSCPAAAGSRTVGDAEGPGRAAGPFKRYPRAPGLYPRITRTT
ncbi:hypothetical protein GCM10023205_12380 [Yinghuangia aomiensis]|uniref:Uncharacterized protein n=1 Tax=Yinghuangia aomiensis TaxID=676205 RepID=A0ABP9GWN5_9ACTN